MQDSRYGAFKKKIHSGQCARPHLHVDDSISQTRHASGQTLKKQTNIIDKLKNPNGQEVHQLAIYKHDRGVELGCTEKPLQCSVRTGLKHATS